jgi:hypothetical protein
VVSRLNENWQAGINFYDQGEGRMLMLSDALTDEIVKQFPAKN